MQISMSSSSRNQEESAAEAERMGFSLSAAVDSSDSDSENEDQKFARKTAAARAMNVRLPSGGSDGSHGATANARSRG